ncbi:hypothetical protein R9806_17935 [Streptomyces sp. KN37]|nr:hypothetical protein [Streptomyces sp. KN37]WPO72378.1 hypothetical protein R9806_17935 [Streptomyces sp. KN37]
MATTPDGGRTTSEERADEILGCYGRGSVVGRFIRRAAPEIHESVGRVRAAANELGVVL